MYSRCQLRYLEVDIWAEDGRSEEQGLSHSVSQYMDDVEGPGQVGLGGIEIIHS